MDTEHREINSYSDIYSFILACSRCQTPDELVQCFVNEIRSYIPFDTASAYLLDSNGSVYNYFLWGVDERWNKIYLGYYMHTDNNRYAVFKTTHKNMSIFDWEHVESSEFVPDFIKARGLMHTCGFGFSDINNRARVSISLDRTTPSPFTQEELNFIRAVMPVINSLHRNFYYTPKVISNSRLKDIGENLTARESQIAELLCQSLSPGEISRELNIAQSTTYKHIANIYAKLHVSSQRELLAMLLTK